MNQVGSVAATAVAVTSHGTQRSVRSGPNCVLCKTSILRRHLRRKSESDKQRYARRRVCSVEAKEKII